MKKPNFFIIGAPKCGTTSLAYWLSEHPDIFMSKWKEPQYFATDIVDPSKPKSPSKYEKLFIQANSRHKAVGEASTRYLRSKEAVSNILKYSPSARFIVCLRNPLEMVVSSHAQRLKEGVENETIFERAWSLQSERQQGKNIPITCRDKSELLYGGNAMFGDQIERLFQIVPPEKVLVILIEDMKMNARNEYKRVLRFLGVEDDGRQNFPVKNVRAIPHYPIIAQFTSLVALVKARMGLRAGFGIGRLMNYFNNQPRKAQILSPEMEAILRDYFKKDVELLSRILDRDLSHWLT